MAHIHSVYDSDIHFSINPVTRAIKNESGKVTLIQHDHNSERFTFEIPRKIEEHDMSLCNKVYIHYINIDSSSSESYSDIYEVDDLQISPESDDIVIFSWLISHFSTKYVGSLNFVIRFECVDDNGIIDYAWNTAVHSGIAVSNGIYNSKKVYNDNTDLLHKWKNQIDASIAKLNNCEDTVNQALEKSNQALKTSQQANDRFNDCVEATNNANAVRSEVEAGGYIESLKEMNNGGKFLFWVGTQAEYDNLTEKIDNCLYLITDSTDGEVFEQLKTFMDGTADYVVERGLDGIWGYRKWASGLAECWGTTDFISLKTTTPWGCLYAETNEVGSVYVRKIDLPKDLFISNVGAVANIHGDGAILIPYTICRLDHIDYSALSPVEPDKETDGTIIPRTCKFHFVVRGRWKE